MGRFPGRGKTPLAGVRSPPLRGVGRPRRVALRWKAWDSAGVVVSEGRGLRAREYGQGASRGIPFPPDG